jgi:hypothetical protein
MTESYKMTYLVRAFSTALANVLPTTPLLLGIDIGHIFNGKSAPIYQSPSQQFAAI